jgi:hypothetical protein
MHLKLKGTTIFTIHININSLIGSNVLVMANIKIKLSLKITPCSFLGMYVLEGLSAYVFWPEMWFS